MHVRQHIGREADNCPYPWMVNLFSLPSALQRESQKSGLKRGCQQSTALLERQMVSLYQTVRLVDYFAPVWRLQLQIYVGTRSPIYPFKTPSTPASSALSCKRQQTITRKAQFRSTGELP
eukprot:4690158-Amphidinium_carterae.2